MNKLECSATATTKHMHSSLPLFMFIAKMQLAQVFASSSSSFRVRKNERQMRWVGKWKNKLHRSLGHAHTGRKIGAFNANTSDSMLTAKHRS